MGKFALVSTMLLVTCAWVALIIAITTLDWMVVSNTVGTVRTKYTWSVIGRVYVEVRTTTAVNTSSVATVTDYWSQTCSGLCIANATIPSCSDLLAISSSGSEQQQFFYDGVCAYSYVALVLCAVALGVTSIAFAIMVITLWGVIPPIYSSLVIAFACAIVFTADMAYGIGIVSRATNTNLGIGATSYWQIGYSFGLAIAAACTLFVAALVALFFKDSIFGTPVAKPATIPSFMASPMQPVIASPFASSVRQPYIPSVSLSGRPPPTLWNYNMAAVAQQQNYNQWTTKI